MENEILINSPDYSRKQYFNKLIEHTAALYFATTTTPNIAKHANRYSRHEPRKAVENSDSPKRFAREKKKRERERERNVSRRIGVARSCLARLRTPMRETHL
jgi:hypothetical protein